MIIIINTAEKSWTARSDKNTNSCLKRLIKQLLGTYSDIDQLKRVLIDCWAQLSHDTLNRAIDQLPKKLMMVIKAKGAHVEFRLD